MEHDTLFIVLHHPPNPPSASLLQSVFVWTSQNKAMKIMFADIQSSRFIKNNIRYLVPRCFLYEKSVANFITLYFKSDHVTFYDLQGKPFGIYVQISCFIDILKLLFACAGNVLREDGAVNHGKIYFLLIWKAYLNSRILILLYRIVMTILSHISFTLE